MPLIVALLQILVTLGVGPSWLAAIIPLIIDYGPAAEILIMDLVKAVEKLAKDHPIVFVNSVPNMIPAYDANGVVILIPNPDYPTALAVEKSRNPSFEPSPFKPSVKTLTELYQKHGNK